MKQVFDTSPPLFSPVDLVTAIIGKGVEELELPERAIITFHTGDLRRLTNRVAATPVDAWSPFRPVYRFKNKETIVVRSHYGGPNIAALVEEFSAFGVKEFLLWGYCGALKVPPQIGDILFAEGAVREDGVSHHYVADQDGPVYSGWVDGWKEDAAKAGFFRGLVWSCDAIYRETRNKVTRYADMGITGVEMEVASFYSVSNYRAVRSMAFLVVSDLLTDGIWTSGFRHKEFKEGVRRLVDFLVETAIR